MTEPSLEKRKTMGEIIKSVEEEKEIFKKLGIEIKTRKNAWRLSIKWCP